MVPVMRHAKSKGRKCGQKRHRRDTAQEALEPLGRVWQPAVQVNAEDQRS